MDNYILVGNQDPAAPALAAETPRRFRKVGFIGVLLVGCGFMWQAGPTPFAKGVGMSYNITGVYTEADLVKIFGRDGPKPEHIRRPQMMVATHGQVDVDSDLNSHDIYQGMLGDCYFDAALAAIAHRHKNLIAAMFEHIDTTQGIFRTRWFFGGRWVSVAVNAKIPVSPSRHAPFFLWTSSELTMWPAILEKSYAKLVGTYKGIESGDPGEAMQYLLGVPVNLIQDFSGTWSNIQGATSLDDVWNQIVHAVDNHYPMGIGTGRGGYHGIAGGHAYTLYGYSNNYRGHGRSVRIRNPWGHNRYVGTITGQSQTIGDFWITWDEFIHNFIDLRIGLVRPGYQTAQLPSVPVTAQGVRGAVRFQINHNGPFSVQALWLPSRVTTAAHCPGASVQFWNCPNIHTCPTRFLLSRSGSSALQIGHSTLNGMRVDGQGAGTWTVELVLDGHFSGLPEISLSANVPTTGSLSLAAAPELLPTLLVSTSDAQLVSTDEALHNLATLQPIETPSCSDYYGRLTQHMNGNVVPSDPYFPESLSSIADAGVDCGDAAHGFHQACSDFNHWQDMIAIGDMETDDLNCFAFTPAGSQCHVFNQHCNRNAVLFCHIVGCDITSTPTRPNYGWTNLDAACCGCNDPSNFR